MVNERKEIHDQLQIALAAIEANDLEKAKDYISSICMNLALSEKIDRGDVDWKMIFTKGNNSYSKLLDEFGW